MNKSDGWEDVNPYRGRILRKVRGFLRPFRFQYAGMIPGFRTDECGYHESARPDTTDGAVT